MPSYSFRMEGFPKSPAGVLISSEPVPLFLVVPLCRGTFAAIFFGLFLNSVVAHFFNDLHLFALREGEGAADP